MTTELKETLTGSDSGDVQATIPPVVAIEPAAEPVVDYKAQYEALQQEKEKLANDLKSLQGQRGKQAQVEAKIETIANRMDAMYEGQRVLMKLYQPDADREAVQREYDEVQAKHTNAQSSRRIETRYNYLLEQMKKFGADQTGNTTYSDERTSWNSIVDNETIPINEKLIDLALVVGDAKAKWERQQEKDEAKATEAKVAKQQEDAIKAAEKKALEKAGVLDMDTGGSGASVVEESPAALAKRYAAGDYLTDEQKKKAHAHLDGLSRAPGSLLRRK